MKPPVTIDIEISETMGGRRGLGWKDGAGNRYHVWLKAPTEAGLREVEVIYKNSCAKPREPGYYDTRQLDARKAKNVNLLRQVFDAAIAGDLWAKAIASDCARREATEAEQRAAAYRHAVTEAGPQLLALLIELRDSAQLVAGGRPTLQHIISKADIVIADLTPAMVGE